jgi:hypothetical protein
VARFCPNCSAQLRSPETECWNCGALFGEGSAWTPTDRAVGSFELRAQPVKRVAGISTGMEVNLGGRLVLKGMAYFLFLAVWLIVGGAFTIGPWTAHHIDKAVGAFVLYGAALFWVGLPITALIATVKHDSATAWRALGVNLLLWLLFLAVLYIRWIRAYPQR